MVKKKPLPQLKFITKSPHIKAILNEFVICYPIKGTVLHDLEIEVHDYDYGVVYLELTLSRFLNQGCVGEVIITPINDDEVLIRVKRMSGPTLWGEEQEEIYTEAWKFLRLFWKYLQNVLSDNQPGSIIPTIEEVDAGQGAALTGAVHSGEKPPDEQPEAQQAGAAIGPKKPKQKRGPHQQTVNNLETLRAIRLRYIQDNRPIPKRLAAMDEANITDKTWKNHDLELYVNWFDKKYRPENKE